MLTAQAVGNETQTNPETKPTAFAQARAYSMQVDSLSKESGIGVMISKGTDDKLPADKVGQILVNKLNEHGEEAQYFTQEGNNKHTAVIFYVRGYPFVPDYMKDEISQTDDRVPVYILNLRQAASHLWELSRENKAVNWAINNPEEYQKAGGTFDFAEKYRAVQKN